MSEEFCVWARFGHGADSTPEGLQPPLTTTCMSLVMWMAAGKDDCSVFRWVAHGPACATAGAAHSAAPGC